MHCFKQSLVNIDLYYTFVTETASSEMNVSETCIS